MWGDLLEEPGVPLKEEVSLLPVSSSICKMPVLQHCAEGCQNEEEAPRDLVEFPYAVWVLVASPLGKILARCSHSIVVIVK